MKKMTDFILNYNLLMAIRLLLVISMLYILVAQKYIEFTPYFVFSYILIVILIHFCPKPEIPYQEWSGEDDPIN